MPPFLGLLDRDDGLALLDVDDPLDPMEPVALFQFDLPPAVTMTVTMASNRNYDPSRHTHDKSGRKDIRRVSLK